MTLGERIKTLRETLRYSQREFGEKIESSQTAVSQYELGQKQPSLAVLNRIIKFAKLNKVKIKLLDE